jgi:hypothetical protein
MTWIAHFLIPHVTIFAGGYGEVLQDRAAVVGPVIALAFALMLGLITIADVGDDRNAQGGQNEGRSPITTQPPVISPPTW